MAKRKRKINFKGIILLVTLTALALFSAYIYGTYFNKTKFEMPKLTNPLKQQPKKINIVDVDSKSRPFAVMINNISVARPLQSGLQDAYIIYEIVTEGGITRYLALFKDQETERIGMIRSARHYYLDYALENDAYFAHHGQSPQALSDFRKLKVNTINSNHFLRDKSLKVAVEHTSYTTMELLQNAVTKSKYRNETNKPLLLNYVIDYNIKNEKNKKEAKNINIKYSNSSTSNFIYDTKNKVYKMQVNGKDNTDYVTKKAYTFKNIITYQVKNTTITGDGAGRQELDNIGTGEGYYITEGYAISIKWAKDSRESQTKYYKMDGTVLEVADGNTYIGIQPKGEKLEVN